MSTTDASPGARGVLVATCLSTLVVNANTSAVSILLPAISSDTGMSVTTLQWAVTGYSLVGAATIVTSGSLGDVFGRKRIFQLGLLLFTASCVLIALSDSGGMVIAGRAIQGAAGATILACGLSLLSVANRGEAQLRAVSLWGAAAAVGAAAGPLLGGVLVEVTGWQGVVLGGRRGRRGVHGADGRYRARVAGHEPAPLDRLGGSLLVALTLMPFVLALSKGSDWGWTSLATLGCLAVGVVRASRSLRWKARRRPHARPGPAAQPDPGRLDDRHPHRRRHDQRADVPGQPVLPGSGHPRFQPVAGRSGDPAGHRRAGRGRAARAAPRSTVRRPSGRRHRVRHHRRRIRGGRLGRGSWRYAAFVLPLVAVAVGMGLSNGPASSAATASVPANQVGAASGVSNMARYVGAAVATALAATIYGGVIADRTVAGQSNADALSAGLAAASWTMAAFSLAGVVMAVVMGRHRAARGTLADSAAAAAAHTHTLPTSATPTISTATATSTT